MNVCDRSLLLAHRFALAIVTLCLIGFTGFRPAAHKGMISPYTFNDHVYPILRDRCGSCHFEGGPTPMSLLSYESAAPWAEAMREQLISQAMPPSFADPLGPAVIGERTISPRELDVLLMWAGGGTPQGDPLRKPVSAPTAAGWGLGPPDLTISMTAEHMVPANTSEEIREFILPTGLTESKWVSAADLRPGAPSMVRDAVVRVENGPILTQWGPAHAATRAPAGTAFELPAGAKLRLKIHYKKNYRDKQVLVKDRSRIGLYFARPPVSRRGIQAVTLTSSAAAGQSSKPMGLSSVLQGAVRVLAVRPTLDQDYASLAVEAVLPTGRRTLLRLLAPRANWSQRYWLSEPVELPRGTHVQVTAIPASPQIARESPHEDVRLQVALDFVMKQ